MDRLTQSAIDTPCVRRGTSGLQSKLCQNGGYIYITAWRSCWRSRLLFWQTKLIE